MTSAGEAEFIALWNEGLEIAVIAQRLDIPKGTVQSRPHRLQQQGKIQPRPRGGAYPSQRALARQHQAPVQRPVHNSAPPGAVHNPVHTSPDHPPPSPDLPGVLNALMERLTPGSRGSGRVRRFFDQARVQSMSSP
jgi:DNA-binding transcriptional MocR family regulator